MSQKLTFAPNWNWRAVPTIVVICPAVATRTGRVEHGRRRQAEVHVVRDVEAFERAAAAGGPRRAARS